MTLGSSTKIQKIIYLTSTLSLVFSLLILALFCLAEVSKQSHPHLDKHRLQRAYKPHAHGGEITVSDLEWSPDGRHAFYTISQDEKPGFGPTWNTLFSVRRNGSHIRRLFVWQHPGEHHPDTIEWSPDSHRIVIRVLNSFPASSVNADGVDLLDIDSETGEKRKLSRDLDGKPGTGSVLWRPGYYVFSPDGKSLLLTLGSGRQTVTNKRLVRIEYATGKRSVLTSPHMASCAGRWSPDGTHIAYIAVPDSGGVTDKGLPYEERVKHQHLYIMTMDGRHKRRLTQDSGYFEEEPTWSANGRTISFVRRKLTDNDWSRSFWTVHPDGTALIRVRALPPKDD